ncbi:MAG: hypothetical protein V1716_04415, partial [Candidatus Uhrbacteria bacterium]
TIAEVFSLYFCINKQRLLLLSAYILSLFIILGLGKSGLFFGYSGTDPRGIRDDVQSGGQHPRL